MLQVVGITFVNEALIRGMAFFVMGIQESDVSQTLWAMIKAKCKKSLKARHRETECRLVPQYLKSCVAAQPAEGGFVSSRQTSPSPCHRHRVLPLLFYLSNCCVRRFLFCPCGVRDHDRCRRSPPRTSRSGSWRSRKALRRRRLRSPTTTPTSTCSTA